MMVGAMRMKKLPEVDKGDQAQSFVEPHLVDFCLDSSISDQFGFVNFCFTNLSLYEFS